MDMDHLLRVQCICNYMEEAAGAHADALGVGIPRLLEDNLTWVLAKMRLVLHGPGHGRPGHERPGPGERVTVTTWPVNVERLQFRRDFILHDSKDTAFAAALTLWVVMGAQSRRLERFPSYVAALQPKDPPLAVAEGDIRIPTVSDSCPVELSFPVRLADIDQNQHVNNGRYIDFSLEAADCAGASGSLRQIDLIFRAEALRGDVIAVKTALETDAQNSFIHGFFRESDGRELARSRTVFG